MAWCTEEPQTRGSPGQGGGEEEMEMNDASMGKKEKGARKREEVDDGKREREKGSR